MARKRTKTSSFGTNGRISHDSKDFYALDLYKERQFNSLELEYLENQNDTEVLNRVYYHDARNMHELKDHSVHLMITSPPYNVGKEYDENLSEAKYKELLRDVLVETYRVLVTGGRACINIANFGRKPYLPAHAWVIDIAEQVGFQMMGEIIWDKADHAAPSTAWGSWKSAASPMLRDSHEYILVFYKQTHSRQKSDGKVDDIDRDEFLTATRSVWIFPPESAVRVDHPAPYPEALPFRLIRLLTFKDEVVLDPFMGSGSTAVAAINSGRHFIGYELESKYESTISARIERAKSAVSSSLSGSLNTNESVPIRYDPGKPPLRTSQAIKSIVFNTFHNCMGSKTPSNSSLSSYFDEVFDSSIEAFRLYPTWACTTCAVNGTQNGGTGAGFSPDRCPVCKSESVFEIGSFQSRASLVGKVFDEAVGILLTNSYGIDIVREPASVRTHRLRIGRLALATRGSPKHIRFPDGTIHTTPNAGMFRSDTRKKILSTVNTFRARNSDMAIAVLTNAISDSDKSALSSDLDVYDVTKVKDVEILRQKIHALT